MATSQLLCGGKSGGHLRWSVAVILSRDNLPRILNSAPERINRQIRTTPL
ncbi:MAG: hypothetical protein M0019_10945 [Actinomycetota bacterium]|nr:hypothetical protein [Actinomycetota bacterium]